MSTPHLTTDEMLDMVEPLTQPAAIVRWFRKQGFEVKSIRPNGLPLISRAVWEAHLSAPSGADEKLPDNPATTPDVAAFLSRFKQKGVGYGPNGTQTNLQHSRS